MANKVDFLGLIAPSAQRVQAAYGVPASIIIAQAALETGWGDKVKGNNLFGIKASSSWKGDVQQIATHEYVNGRATSISDSFRAYGSLDASMADHARLISMRYSDVIRAGNAYDAADALKRGGYATDPRYAEKLKQIIADNDLTRFDDPRYSGYMQNGSFSSFQQRFEKERSSAPALWDSFLNIIATIVSGMSQLVTSILSSDPTPPASTPPAPSKVAGAKLAGVGVVRT